MNLCKTFDEYYEKFAQSLEHLKKNLSKIREDIKKFVFETLDKITEDVVVRC